MRQRRKSKKRVASKRRQNVRGRNKKAEKSLISTGLLFTLNSVRADEAAELLTDCNWEG